MQFHLTYVQVLRFALILPNLFALMELVKQITPYVDPLLNVLIQCSLFDAKMVDVLKIEKVVGEELYADLAKYSVKQDANQVVLLH